MATKDIITHMLENNLDKMRNEINSTLTVKAVERLEEKKIDIAKSYFGQK